MIAGAALALAAGSPAAAQDEVTFTEPGPVDLSGSDHATGNVGERVTLGTLELDDGEWTVAASVRLFVPDLEGAWKNSQGCGLYADGEQVGGAGGSSSLWTATADGKEVVLELNPVDPDADAIVLEGPAVLELECFIDQSHGGATPDQRAGMAATDISMTAVRTPDPTPSPTAEPTTKPTGEPTPEPTETEPAPGKGGELPQTGSALPVLVGLGAGGVALGAAALWLARRRGVGFTA